MTSPQGLSPQQAAEYAIHFGFPNRHCQRMTNGFEWNLDQRNVLDIAWPCLQSGAIVLIHGVRGNGKTQIAAGLGFQWWNRGNHIERGKACYWTLPGIFTKHKQSFNDPKADKNTLQKARDCGLLVLDEIDLDQNSDHDKRELRELIDARYRHGQSPTLLLTNVKPDRLRDALDYSILDRIREGGAIIQLGGTSHRANNPDL